MLLTDYGRDFWFEKGHYCLFTQLGKVIPQESYTPDYYYIYVKTPKHPETTCATALTPADLVSSAKSENPTIVSPPDSEWLIALNPEQLQKIVDRDTMFNEAQGVFFGYRKDHPSIQSSIINQPVKGYMKPVNT